MEHLGRMQGTRAPLRPTGSACRPASLAQSPLSSGLRIRSLSIPEPSTLSRYRALLARRRSCSIGRRARVAGRQEDHLYGGFDRRRPRACPAHAGSHIPTDGTLAHTRLSVRSSCEWAGSLYCVPLPFGVPVQRTVTSRGSMGAFLSLQMVRSALSNPRKRPIPAPAPSPQH